MHDQLQDARSSRLLYVIVPKGFPFGHDFNLEALGIEVDFSLLAERVVRSLDQIIAGGAKPCV